MSDRTLQALLLSHDLVTGEQMETVLSCRSNSGSTWLEELILAGALSEDRMVRCVATSLWFQRCELASLVQIDPAVVARISAAAAVEHRMIPVRVDCNGVLHVAMVDPTDSQAVEELEFFMGEAFVREVACASSIAWALHNYHGVATALWPRPAAESLLDFSPIALAS